VILSNFRKTRIVSYRIESNRIESYRIVSYRIESYRIVSYIFYKFREKETPNQTAELKSYKNKKLILIFILKTVSSYSTHLLRVLLG